MGKFFSVANSKYLLSISRATQIVLPHSLPGPIGGSLPDFGIGDQQPQHAFQAFRSGARGLFCFSQYPSRLLCKCIQSVHQGQVWANSEQMQYLVEALSQVRSLHMVNSRGMRLLTPREEQVVALVADGLSNREVARELCLSEHTIKKYLFRIFDKLGISSRVELVLYALSHGGSRQAEWVAGIGA